MVPAGCHRVGHTCQTAAGLARDDLHSVYLDSCTRPSDFHYAAIHTSPYAQARRRGELRGLRYREPPLPRRLNYCLT